MCYYKESPPEANDHIAEPTTASTAPQTKVNAVEAKKKKDEPAGASSETADVNMKEEAKKNETENMDVDETADEVLYVFLCVYPIIFLYLSYCFCFVIEKG